LPNLKIQRQAQPPVFYLHFPERCNGPPGTVNGTSLRGRKGRCFKEDNVCLKILRPALVFKVRDPARRNVFSSDLREKRRKRYRQGCSISFFWVSGFLFMQLASNGGCLLCNMETLPCTASLLTNPGLLICGLRRGEAAW
jgi:hypothetical protein